MRRASLVVSLVLSSLVVLAPVAQATSPEARASATCSDYDNQRDAQLNKDTRDADGDGIYCEALPCPCLRPGQGAPAPKPKPKRKAKPKPRARVVAARITHVVDGDTIKVRATGGKRYTVRLIGIDTPETKKPGTAVECGGREATAAMLALAFSKPADTDGDGLLDAAGGLGRRVTLRTDPTQDTFDRYKRLLAYVTTVSGRQLNVSQVASGWAETYVFRNKPFQQTRRFRAAERRAKKKARGVWGACGGDFHRRA